MASLTARGQSPSLAFGHSKNCAFHGSCAPGTSSVRCSRLFGHSLLTVEIPEFFGGKARLSNDFPQSSCRQISVRVNRDRHRARLPVLSFENHVAAVLSSLGKPSLRENRYDFASRQSARHRQTLTTSVFSRQPLDDSTSTFPNGIGNPAFW